VVATGTPEQVSSMKQSYTGKFLQPILQRAGVPC
jgi:excinuclease UvrABC ATPase subunit